MSNFFARLGLQDGETDLIIREADIGDHSTLEAGTQSLFQRGNRLGRTVTGEHDLFAVLIQRIEGVEEFFLSLLFARQKLDVVDDQYIDIAINILETLGIASGNRLDEIVGEFFRRGIFDPLVGIVLQNLVADRLQKMGLAQSHAAVDE